MKPRIQSIAAALAVIGVAMAFAVGLTSPASTGFTAEAKTEKTERKVQMLFVQNAKAVEFNGAKMTLKGLNPLTVFFSDRPQRIAGHLASDEFVKMWGEGKDSFTAVPPNATLSVFDGKVTNVVVELRNPVLKGEDMTYDVRVLQGTMPAQPGLCSLFIDVIGMPMTPLSYAGAARRAVVLGPR